MAYKGANDEDVSLWNKEDGMYYDAIQFGSGHFMQLPIRSLVGLIPLYATLTSSQLCSNVSRGSKKE